MGNHLCNCSAEYEAYLKAIASTQAELAKPFFWAPAKNGTSLLHFLEAGTQRLVRVKASRTVGLGLHSTGLYVNSDKILVAGGKDPFSGKVSPAFHIYHVESQKFEPRESLPEPVYGAACAHFLHRFYVLGGCSPGPHGDVPSAKCFEYNFAKHRWYVIAPMNVPRAFAQSFVYQNKIWVIGGRSPDGRGNSAEVFEPHLNVWTIVIERLPFDYAGGVLITLEANRICILGGDSSDGPLRSIHHIDLKKRNIMSKGALKYPRSFPKVVFKNGMKDLALLGGVDQRLVKGPAPELMERNFLKTRIVDMGRHVEAFDFDNTSQNVGQVVVRNEDPVYHLRKVSQTDDLQAHRSHKHSTNSSPSEKDMNFFLENDRNTSAELHDSPVICQENVDSITASRTPFDMRSLPLPAPQPDPQPESPQHFKKLYQRFEIGLDRTDSSGNTRLTLVSLGNSPSLRISKRNYLFGTDEHPFYLFMDRETFECKLKPVPVDLPLFSEQTAIRLDHLNVLFCGGRSFSGSRAFSNTVLYNLREKTVKRLPSLSCARFASSFALFRSRVWLVGGRTVCDGAQVCLDSIETFDEASMCWSDLPARLNQARSGSICFVLSDTLYCAGGIDQDNQPVPSIERYKEAQGQWETMALRLEGNWAGMSVYKYRSDGVIIFGGNKAFKISVDLGVGAPLHCSESVSKVTRSRGTKVADMRIGFVVFDSLDSEFSVHGANTQPEQPGVDEENIVAQLKSVLGRVFTHETSLGDCSLVRPFKQTHFV